MVRLCSLSLRWTRTIPSRYVTMAAEYGRIDQTLIYWPVKWSNGKKTLILIVCSAYSFLGNAALSGVAPYIAIFAMQFGVTPNAASNLLTYPNLAFGFGERV